MCCILDQLAPMCMVHNKPFLNHLSKHNPLKYPVKLTLRVFQYVWDIPRVFELKQGEQYSNYQQRLNNQMAMKLIIQCRAQEEVLLQH